MPRGFLVKRTKKGSYSYRQPRGSEDEEGRSDSERSEACGSEAGDVMPPSVVTNINTALYSSSPDSGYSHSPISTEGIREGNENVAPPRPPPPPLTSDSTADKQGEMASPSTRTSESPSSSPANSPPPLTTRTALPLGSPPGFQFLAFDKLSVYSPHHQRIGPVGGLFPHPYPPPAAHTNSNYLPPPPLTHSMLIPPPIPYKPVLSPVNTSQHLRPVNTSQHLRHNAKSPFNTVLSPAKKRTSSEFFGGDSQPNTPSKPAKVAKKTKAIRKIQFDEDKSSPVSGTIIRDAGDDTCDSYKVCSGDIDSSLNLVEVTPEARAELQKIDNKIGDYICQLCRDRYEDAFQLAQHKCSRIVHVEYRCPECDKVFNCPANLASHRRWHKPRQNQSNNNNNIKSGSKSHQMELKKNLDTMNGNYLMGGKDSTGVYEAEKGGKRSGSPGAETEGQYDCQHCHRRFKREAYLRKHEATHHRSPPAQTEIREDLAEDSYPCHYCGKGMKSEASRTKHILQVHTPGLGGGHFGVPTSMPTMLPPAYPPPPPPPMSAGPESPSLHCQVCSLPFPTKTALERHERLHTTADMFSCKYCSSVFFSSPGLTRHINKCHPSENRQVILLQMPQANRTC